MIEKREINIKGKTIECLEVNLGRAKLVLAVAPLGFIMCGYLDMAAAGRLNDAACIVRGVNSIEELLNAEISDVSAKAKKLGICAGMKAKDALGKLI